MFAMKTELKAIIFIITINVLFVLIAMWLFISSLSSSSMAYNDKFKAFLNTVQNETKFLAYECKFKY